MTLIRNIGLLLFVLTLGACSKQDPLLENMQQFISQQKIDKSVEGWKEKLPLPPKFTFDKNKSYFWILQTNKGNMTIKLYPDVAPMHVSSTAYLTQLGFYDDVVFHRVIPGFMAQGGDPTGTGMGGPGYRYAGEFSPKASHSKAGILSMANAGPNTDGSQFFITFKATQFLDGRHTVFGEVVDGMDTLTQLEQLGSRSGQTKELLKIVKAKIKITNS